MSAISASSHRHPGQHAFCGHRSSHRRLAPRPKPPAASSAPTLRQKPRHGIDPKANPEELKAPRKVRPQAPPPEAFAQLACEAGPPPRRGRKMLRRPAVMGHPPPGQDSRDEDRRRQTLVATLSRPTSTPSPATASTSSPSATTSQTRRRMDGRIYGFLGLVKVIVRPQQ